MREALSLAASVPERDVLPNPRVGALIVRDGKILGKGVHRRYGDIHAEAAALEDCVQAGESPENSDLYVTLEPCSHSSKHKHNGPCTQKILEAGIRRVVIARPDVNPLVRGGGIARLREAGVQVSYGIEEEAAADLNRCYETLQQKKRPYITLKAALTLDGFLAAGDGSSRWISSPGSRSIVMDMRAASQAVLVGRGTWESDSPRLTARDEEGQPRPGPQPRRIILSRKGLPLPELLTQLYSEGVYRLLVEGGQGVFQSFIQEGLWDVLHVFQSPDILGSGLSFTGGLGIGSMKEKLVLNDRTTRIIGRDVEIRGYREGFSCLRV